MFAICLLGRRRLGGKPWYELKGKNAKKLFQSFNENFNEKGKARLKTLQ